MEKVRNPSIQQGVVWDENSHMAAALCELLALTD